MNIKILFEDEDFVAIDKPSGLLVHPHAYSENETLTDWILEKYPDIKNVGEPLTLNNGTEIARPGIVHRIDKETSGVLVIAKNESSFQNLKDQFQNRKVKKNYKTFVWGTFALKDGESEIRGIIDKPIGRSASDFRRKSAEKGLKGTQREAITEYLVLEQNKEFSYLDIFPKTGRTHQIRVHLKSISRPIVGDKMYAERKPFALGFERLALHAHSVVFTNMKGEEIKVESPLPDDFVGGLKLLQNIE